MKNKRLNGAIVILIVVLLFSFCTGKAGAQTINSATELKAYLDKQPANSPDKPIKVAMKVNDMMIKDIVKVMNEAGKYVSLDLSGSPLTEIPRFVDFAKGCTTLVGIIIPNGVTTIGDYTFNGCTSLTSVTIPNSVTSIGQYAFSFCPSLTSVTIGNSVTSIGYRAFAICESLTNITIPNSVTSIGEDAFGGCTSLTRVTIPNGVTSIGERTFQNSGLTSVTIPNSVTSIGTAAFLRCTSLTSITIPNSVTSIEEGAFAACTSLTSVTFQGTIPSSRFSNDAFANNPQSSGDLRTKYLAGGIGTYTRPNGNGATWTKK